MRSIFIYFLFIQIGNSIQEAINCAPLKESFANATSNFVSCAVNYSRPITLCGSCIVTYMNIIESYANMTKFVVNGTRCIDDYVNLDRLQIFDTLYANSYNLWNNAKCDKCFKFNNRSLTSNRSEEAIEFERYYENFTQCLEYNILDDTICKNCADHYYGLNIYYHSISNENEEIATCMDMVDLMNTTRSLWSQTCCKYRRHNEYIFIASTVTVLIITLFFYVATQFCSVRKSPTIVQQRRFAESFNQTSHAGER